MRVDLRVKHDIEARKAAIGLFERGHGSESAAKALSVPRDTVRQWLYVYRSFGSEVLLSMDGKQARYTYEQKVAAASAVVDGGMSKRDAMEAFGVMSPVPLPRSAATTWTRTFPWQTGSRAATSTATWPISTRSTCTTSRRKDCLLLLNRSHGDIDRLTV